MEKTGRKAELEALIKKHQELYYNKNAEITDEQFDLLWDELKQIDPNNSIFEKVGQDASDGFNKAPHIMPMGSQEKASDVPSFLEWAKKQKTNMFIVQYKLDGASLELQYKNGKLLKAVTRGDGKIGDDITENALKMGGVLKELKNESALFSGAVRGEVLMPRKAFFSIYADKANCRNAANGIMKRKDGKGCEDLVVVCYDVAGGDEGSILDEKTPYKDEIEKIEWLKNSGFNTVCTHMCENAEEIVAYREETAKIREQLEFDIDGLVVKNVELDLEDLKRVRPEKQIAFKFELEKAISKILSVEWSESGVTYTPIALIEPVHLAGTTVKRASLANPNVIKNLNLMIGSKVLVSKRGEIIPKIESLLENPENSTPIDVPSHCFACGSLLKNEGTRLYCPNPKCKKVAEHRVEKWVKVLDMKEVGSVLLKRLFESGNVTKIQDLYELKVEDIANIERMGELSSKKVYQSIHAKKEVSLADFIAGFDIEDLGHTMAEKIVAKGYDSIEKLFLATAEDIEQIDGFAQKMASTFIGGLGSAKNEMIELLESGHVSIKKEKEDGALKGLSFCFTGELESMSRKEAIEKSRRAGAIIKSGVSKDLDYLVTNNPASNSSKLEKAKEFSIKIISEKEWLALF